MKKNLIWLGVAVCLLLFSWWLIAYLSHGRLVVVTNNSSNKIYVADKNSNPIAQGSNGSLKVKLKSGRYIVSVKGASIASYQVVNVAARHTTTLNINPSNTKGVEPVYDGSATSVKASSTELVALDIPSKTIYEIDSQNKVTQLFPSSYFQSVKWADPQTGVALDYEGRLFLIKNGALSQMQVPFSYSANQAVNYTITPSGQIYVSYGKDVYQDSGSGLKKICTVTAPPSLLAAAGDNLAIVEEQEGNGTAGDASSITILNKGKRIASMPGGTFVAAWSPSGRYLAISGTMGGQVLDSSLKLVATIPQPGLGNPVWQNDTSLFYSINDQLWVYTLSDQSSRLAANMPLGGAISEISMNDDYAYLVAQKGAGDSSLEIKRVGLKDQQVPKAVYQLQDILPENADGCTLTLVNFSRPTVEVSPQGSDCENTARSTLGSRGFDVNTLSITGYL